jgi:hypothetical protein
MHKAKKATGSSPIAFFYIGEISLKSVKSNNLFSDPACLQGNLLTPIGLVDAGAQTQ